MTSKGVQSAEQHPILQQTSTQAKQKRKDSHLPPPSEQEEIFSSVFSGQEDEVFSPAPAETPVDAESFESDAGDPHPSSPSEDFSSYVEMISRMAKTLKMQTEQPPPPLEDLIFGDIDQERSQPLSLAFIPALMNLIKESWNQLSNT